MSLSYVTKKLSTSTLKTLIGLALISGSAQAATVDVTVTNLTQGLYFTPIMLAAQDGSTTVFQVGSAASSDLRAMAEGGDTSGLQTLLTSAGAVISDNPAAGLLAPGGSATASAIDTGTNNYLSVAAMILPSNDGFIGVNQWEIPSEAGTYTIDLNAYDAGTEANDEIRGGGTPGEAGFPVPGPLDALLGQNGSGVTVTESNQNVHIHRSSLGDTNATGGTSDIDSTVQRWLNPVARITVVVQ